MLEVPVLGKLGMPFMAAGIVAAKINNTRMAEAVIIAVVSGGVIAACGYFIALPVLQEQMAQATRQMTEIKTDVKELRTEIKEDRVRTAVELRVTNDRMQRMELDAARRVPREQREAQR